MPRAAAEENSRISLRIRTEEKKLLLRAVALQHTDLTDFVIEQAEHAQLSGRGTVCGFWICWRILPCQMHDYWPSPRPCLSNHDPNGMA